jgi:hypothetical protein
MDLAAAAVADAIDTIDLVAAVVLILVAVIDDTIDLSSLLLSIDLSLATFVVVAAVG